MCCQDEDNGASSGKKTATTTTDSGNRARASTSTDTSAGAGAGASLSAKLHHVRNQLSVLLSHHFTGTLDRSIAEGGIREGEIEGIRQGAAKSLD